MYFSSRRRWLQLVSGYGLATGLPDAGTRVLSEAPLITAQDFADYPNVLTPAADFYVRNHFAVPAVDVADWKISIGGALRREMAGPLAGLRGPKQHGGTSPIECARKGRGIG